MAKLFYGAQPESVLGTMTNSVGHNGNSAFPFLCFCHGRALLTVIPKNPTAQSRIVRTALGHRAEAIMDRSLCL